MSKGGKGAPKSDGRIAEAALLSAQTGKDYLDVMKGQAAVANKWAAEDRDRYKGVFQPLEDEYIADAKTWASPGRKMVAASEASADVQLAGTQAGEAAARQAQAMGVNPASGAFLAGNAKNNLTTTLAAAGAGNMARRRIEGEADQRQANAINLGKGLAVNPGTSLGLANSATSQGFSGAMQGYQQQGNLLNQDFQNKMQTWQANQSTSQGLWGAVGNLAGMIPGGSFAMLSDEDAKTDKKPVKRSLLKAVENMPVEEWSYKPGEGDEGRHVGTYAQDFQRETGQGDGRSINVIDAIGTIQGAVKELSAKVDKISKPHARRLAA